MSNLGGVGACLYACGVIFFFVMGITMVLILVLGGPDEQRDPIGPIGAAVIFFGIGIAMLLPLIVEIFKKNK